MSPEGFASAGIAIVRTIGSPLGDRSGSCISARFTIRSQSDTPSKKRIALSGSRADVRIGDFMYSHILVPLENSPADDTVLQHVAKLAEESGARVSLIHVADGYVARNYDQLKLAPSQEMLEDAGYLDRRENELKKLNIA